MAYSHACNYSGMLPCFFRGRYCFLVARISRSSHILFLVSLGIMMSSIKPARHKQIMMSSIKPARHKQVQITKLIRTHKQTNRSISLSSSMWDLLCSPNQGVQTLSSYFEWCAQSVFIFLLKSWQSGRIFLVMENGSTSLYTKTVY